MKTLVIINGVTGAIGSACLARFSRANDTTIIGLSRQAPPIEEFCEDGFLFDNTLICKIGDITDKNNCENLAQRINKDLYQRIVYTIISYP